MLAKSGSYQSYGCRAAYVIVSEHTNFNLKTTIEGWFPNFSSLTLILHLSYPFFNHLCNLSMTNIDNSGLCVNYMPHQY